ncbi:hypothetical protein [Chryseobacterium indologenes]|uniref:Uncharacterized protein n=1 Tax=Chryseobacterium indologenes TaxID=253 RepID=A0A0N0ITP0_CHRID|nr:hypothetical protein [Chryseobacterium indologenes]KPE48931.1 hypothetical protein AOB46_22740 [Chryseobacterium indologenes]
MKKTALLLSVAAGISAFAQSSPIIIQNYNVYDAAGRFRTAPAGGTPGPIMYAGHNAPYGTYTIPAGQFTQYQSFSTAGTTPIPILNWYVSDNTNPANNGMYAYNHPFIATVMNYANEWASFHFVIQDPVTGASDEYKLGDPTIDPAYSNSLTGSISSADWFTITTPNGPTTYVQIF